MQSSLTITKISAALVKAQSEMSNAIKDAINPFFNKKYADLNSIREACLPVLNKHGISAIQPTCIIDGINYVETILLHESGEFISSLSPIISAKNDDPQKHGSGLSYARRYALQSIVNIGAEDDDANAATPKAGVAQLANPIIPKTEKLISKKIKDPDPILVHAAADSLRFTTDFATLQAAWVLIPADIKPIVESVKNEMKAKFKPPVQVTQAEIAK